MIDHDDYLGNNADATRLRIHPHDERGWIIDAADDDGRHTLEAWDWDFGRDDRIMLDRALVLARSFALEYVPHLASGRTIPIEWMGGEQTYAYSVNTQTPDNNGA